MQAEADIQAHAGTQRGPATLLAPAGDWEALRAAVANGADAVYFGLKEFNARHRANNFETAELPELMRYLHRHNVRGYLTFNILIFPDELEQAILQLHAAAQAGVDAVIVQDLGLAALLQRALPALEVHGSTQMTLTEPRGVEFVRSLGVKLVVLARELSVKDIRRITQASDMPVEVFVHGALCVSYSGQCLTSEALGGRSANRGQCAQACRLPYDLVVDGQRRELGDLAYLLSPQDLAAYDLMHELVDAGVTSFKIEGRLKHAHYVAATCQTYREALDQALKRQPFHIASQQYQDLAQSFSRGFGAGFLSGVNHQQLVNGTFSKKRGLRVGKVHQLFPTHALIELDADAAALKPGDGVVFQQGADQNHEVGGRVVRFDIRGRFAQLTLHALDPLTIPLASVLWKTDDPAIRKRLEASYARDAVQRRRPVHFVLHANAGEAARLEARDDRGLTATAVSPAPLQLATRIPLKLSDLRQQLDRLGDTPFELASAELRVAGQPADQSPAMLPKSVLNELRRAVVEQLIGLEAAETGRRTGDATAAVQVLRDWQEDIGQRHPVMPARAGAAAQMHALVRSAEQLEAAVSWRGPDGRSLCSVCCEFEDVKRYPAAVKLARDAGLPVTLASTRIIKPGEEGLLNQLLDAQPDAVLVRNLAALMYCKERAPQLQLIGDYALNVANELTADLFLKQGLRRLTPSYDLSWTQLTELLRRMDPGVFEVVIHQHMPMFHMEHCVFAHTMSDGADFRTCGRPCEKHHVELGDRVGVPHPLLADVGCRNTVYNGMAQSAAEYLPRMLGLGLKHFRVELLRDSAEETRSLLTRYARILAGLDSTQAAWRSLKVLSQLGVTRGTLD